MLHIIKFIRGYSSVEFSKFNRFVHLSPQFNFRILLLLLLLLLSHFSGVRPCATLWTIACQAPLSMGFSRQEHWSGLLCPSPGDLPDPRNKPASLILRLLHWQVGSLLLVPPGKPQPNQSINFFFKETQMYQVSQ